MSAGLIAPLVSHRFRVDLHGNAVFQQSVETFDVNVVRKEVVVSVRETCDCQIMPLVVDLASYQSSSMTWEALDNATRDPIALLFFHGLKLIDHSFGTSYIATASAKHVLTFSYERMERK